MDVSAEKISEIINDPESMRNIAELSEMLKNGIAGNDSPQGGGVNVGAGCAAAADTDTVRAENAGDTSDFSGLFDGIDFSQILQIISLLSDPPKDKNVDFLAALKPLMSEDKRPKIERTIKFLKLYDMYEVLKENGILTGIGDLI